MVRYEEASTSWRKARAKMSEKEEHPSLEEIAMRWRAQLAGKVMIKENL